MFIYLDKISADDELFSVGDLAKTIRVQDKRHVYLTNKAIMFVFSKFLYTAWLPETFRMLIILYIYIVPRLTSRP